MEMIAMTDVLFILLIAAPYVAVIVTNYAVGKDMTAMAETIKDMSLQIKVLSTHAASMDDKINGWNPYKKGKTD